MKKINAILLIHIFLGLPFVVFALENTYPPLPEAPSPINLVTYVRYIYVFIFFLGLAIATIQLILAGTKFIWASPNPNEIKEARQKAFAALLGLGILLGSYLLLRTINPQLVGLSSLPPLKSFPATLPPGPQDTIFRGDLMERIKKMAEETKTLLTDNVKKSGEDIKKATENCDCANTSSLCYCDKPGKEASCKPQKCYVAPNSHPCKDKDLKQIKENQEKIIFFSDAILYYKNRSVQEVKDLKENVKVLEEQIRWYLDNIKTAKENERKSKTTQDRKFWQELSKELEKGRQRLAEEKENKEHIGPLLEKFEKSLEPFTELLKKIIELPEECRSKVENKCQPSCKDNKQEGYGCYEAPLGCQPNKCKGGNPCPQKEINSAQQKINEAAEKTIQILEQIIKKIEDIQRA